MTIVLAVGSAPGLSPAQTLHYPDVSVCANFSDPREPGATPTFPGLWVNTRQTGQYWHINYLNHPDPRVAFTWMTFENGTPVWYQSASSVWNSFGGTGQFTLKRFRAEYEPVNATQPNGPQRLRPLNDAGVPAYDLTARVVPNDPSLLAISIRPAGVISAPWQDHCIHDASRVGPFFVPSQQPSAVNPNASFTGLYYEPELGGYGVAWTILQIPQPTGASKYLEALHLLTYDDNGEPTWFEARQCNATTELPPAERTDSNQLVLRKPRSTNHGSSSCPGSGEQLGEPAGHVWRMAISPARADMHLWLQSAAATQLKRPSAHFPATLPPSTEEALASGHVRLVKLTATNQIVLDRAACVVTTTSGGTKCDITLNWGAVLPGDGSLTNFRVESVAMHAGWMVEQISANLVGQAIRSLSAGDRYQFRLIADRTSTSGSATQILDKTVEVRAVADTDLPIVEFNAPAGCPSESECIVHPVNSAQNPMQVRIAVSTPLGVAKVELFEGEDPQSLTPLCGAQGCTLHSESGQYRYSTWVKTSPGTYSLWARAYTQEGQLVSPSVKRIVRFGTPPSAALKLIAQNGAENPQRIGTHEPVTLSVQADDPGVLVENGPFVKIKKIEFFRYDDGVESPIGIAIDRIEGVNPPYTLPWPLPRTAGTTQVRARVTDSQGTNGVSAWSNFVPLIVESPAASLTLQTHGSGVLDAGQFPPVQLTSFETGAPGAFFRTLPVNPHNFKRIWFRIQRGSESVIDLPVCDSVSTCNRSEHYLAWAPSVTQKGSWTVTAMGTLVNDLSIVSPSANITVGTRHARSVQLTEQTGATSVIAHADDPVELIDLARNMLPWAVQEQRRQMPRWPCVGVVRSADVGSVEQSQCSALAGMAGKAISVGRCGTELGPETSSCYTTANFSLSAMELCPQGVESCVKEQDLVLAAHTKYDGFRQSSPIHVQIPFATFIGDADVPTQLAPGRIARIKVTFRNSGGTPWTPADYRLRAVNPASGQSWGVGEGISPSSTIAKNATVTFEFDVTAPQTAGPQTVQWQLHRKRGETWDSFGQMSLPREIDVRVLDPLSAATDSAAVSVSNPIATHDPTIGAIAGQASVSGGAATYEIPIVVPPGRRGMQPQLALAYSSRNGNGAVGVGWSLSGLSSIHRCPRTIAQDGYSKAVGFLAEDALCLDGQRLVALVEANYGKANAEYRTEIESYQKIVQRGGDLQSSAVYFDVLTRSGELIVYGPGKRGTGAEATDAAARPLRISEGMLSASTLSWLMAYREDSVGNSASYFYTTYGSGETLLSEVRYTGFRQSDGDRRVELTYGDEAGQESGVRSDSSSAYLAQHQTRQTKLLNKIETSVGSTLVRRYSLQYTRGDGTQDPTHAGTGRNLLDTVTECAADASDAWICRAPTRFAWDKGGPAYALEADGALNPGSGALHEYLGEFHTSVRLSAAADFDGDGSRDIFWIGPTSEADTTPRARIMTLSPERQRKSIIEVDFSPDFVTRLIPAAHLGLADFDRDGRPELIGGNGTHHALYFWRRDPIPSDDPVTMAAVFDAVPTDIPGTGKIRQVGDMNGDGKPDVVVEETGAYCPHKNRIVVYQYTGFVGGVHQFIDGGDHFELERHCQDTDLGPDLVRSQVLERIADFDGDGIPDFWLRAGEHHDGHEIRLGQLHPDQLGPSQRYTIGAPTTLASLRMATSPPDSRLDAQEIHKQASAFWLDANGDGLDDWFYPVNISADSANRQPRWALRLNIGGKFGPRKVFTHVVADVGLHARECHTSPDDQQCTERWVPWRTDRMRSMDFDSDGRQDLLVPTSYAGRVCSLRYEKATPNGLVACPPGDEPPFEPTMGTPQITLPPAKFRQTYPNVLASVIPGPAPAGETNSCVYRYYCPEPMQDHPAQGYRRGELETESIHGGAAVVGRVKLRNAYGQVDSGNSPSVRAEDFKGLYSTGGADDFSSYNVAALRFVEVGGSIELSVVSDTGVVLGNSSFDAGDDVYGDGVGDLITKVSCYERNLRANLSDGCGQPRFFRLRDVLGDPERLFVEIADRLPNDAPLMTPAVLINMNYGAAVNDFGLPAPVDLMTTVTDGEGNQATWSYSPLGAKAGRQAAETPLYSRSFPKPHAVPYTDADHIYFTSSMPVVAEMHTTVGNSALVRRHRYGYIEAMYHLEGRGFQGFRGIVEEDLDARTRVTTTFHQKYPLTGKVQSVTTEVVAPSGSAAMLSEESFAWSCTNDSLVAETGCMSDADRSAPFLASKKTLTYAAKAVPDGTVPPLSSERIEITAAGDASFCSTGTIPSGEAGIDDFGNVIHTASVVFDRGPTAALAGQCERIVSKFDPPLTATDDTRGETFWWLDALDRRTVTQAVAYTADFDDGAPDTKVVTTTFDWNADRTLQSSTVAPVTSNSAEDAEKSVTTSYLYTTHGLPRETTVSFQRTLPGATAATNALRTSAIGYEPTGYFPATLTNALQQVTTVSHRTIDGQLRTTIDPNGIQSVTTFDAFGAPIEVAVSKPNESRTLLHPQHLRHARPGAVSDITCPADTRWVSTQVQAGAPTQITCHDAVGRARRQITQMASGVASKVDAVYDARGLLLKQTEPFAGSEAAYWTEFGGYDFAGRPAYKLVDKPGLSTGNAHGDLRTDYVYAGRTTTITVRGTAGSTPVGVLTMSRTQDSLGRYIETHDAATPTAGVTRFWHDALGNVSAIRDAKQVMTTATYDALGRRIEVVDPNQGTWSFEYNGLGELTEQTDARGWSTEFAHDALGRVTTRITSAHDVDGTAPDALSHLRTRDTFVFDTEAIGALSSQRRDYLPANAAPNALALRSERAETYAYDALARRDAATIEQWRNGTLHTVTLGWKYDANNGWLSGRHWNGEEGLRYGYDAYGQLTGIGDGADATKAYWARTELDLRGQVTAFTLGNAEINASRQTIAETGQWKDITYRQGATQAGAPLRRYSYGYDLFGNLASQTIDAGPTEAYTYDELHRLTRSTRSPASATAGEVNYAYDAVGNLTAKSDYSAYSPPQGGSPATPHYKYGNSTKTAGGNAGPNAVREVSLRLGGTQQLVYDANGNLANDVLSGVTDGRQFVAEYDAVNLPVRTSRGSSTLTFGYGPDGQRVHQNGSLPEQQRLYFDGAEFVGNGDRHYPIADVGQVVYRGGTRHVEYFATDRLGSIGSILVKAGTVWGKTSERTFDAFGKPRDALGQDATPDTLPFDPKTPRGFTGHEHLDAVRLIHMNGRAYDYNLGRFLGVDPFIQFPLNSQSLNPYSYILNNPQSATDPTGYLVLGQRQFWHQRFRNEYAFSIRSGSSAAHNGADRVSITQFADNDPSEKSASSSNGEVTIGGIAPKEPDSFFWGHVKGITDVVVSLGTQPFLDIIFGTNQVDDEGDVYNEFDWRVYGGSNSNSGSLGYDLAPATLFGASVVLGRFSPRPRPLDNPQPPVIDIRVSAKRHPESAQHVVDAQAAGQPEVLTIRREGKAARRREALSGVERRPGLDRDEYPGAMFEEGGRGSSVRHIDPSDNRGSGACVGAQCRPLPDGTRVRIIVDEES